MKNKLGIILIGAGILYIMAVVIGGFLVPNYNHIYNAISELSESGKSKVFIVEFLFGIYNLMLIVYSFLSIYYKKNSENKLAIIIYIILGLIGLAGVLMGFFPQESRDATLTIAGIMHLVLAGIAAILTMSCTILMFFCFRKHKQFSRYSTYSLITFIIIFISGLSNVILMNNNVSSLFGLIERITIGSFIIWLIVTGMRDIKSTAKEY